jgi:hypothetical protein
VSKCCISRLFDCVCASTVGRDAITRFIWCRDVLKKSYVCITVYCRHECNVPENTIKLFRNIFNI